MMTNEEIALWVTSIATVFVAVTGILAFIGNLKVAKEMKRDRTIGHIRIQLEELLRVVARS